MKKRTVFTLMTLLCFGSVLFAQTKTTVHGNLGVENVNISIANTPYGTSTDAKGHYELPLFDRSEAVHLYYSCIGYQDTVVSLTPRQLQWTTGCITSASTTQKQAQLAWDRWPAKRSIHVFSRCTAAMPTACFSIRGAIAG